MSHACGVSQCGAPTQDNICSTHLRELVDALRSIAVGPSMRFVIHRDWDPRRREWVKTEVEERHPGLWADLDTTLTRQAKMGRSSIKVRGSGEPGSPFHEAASEVQAMALATIRHWKAVFSAANRHLSAGPVKPPEVCSWMAGFPALLAQLTDAAVMHADFVGLAHHRHGAIPRVIDRAPDRVYLGICSGRTDDGEMCTEDVYAIEGYTHTKCRVCDTTHEVAARREKLRESMEDVVATAVDCSRMADLFGTAVTTERIRKWKERGHLFPAGVDGRGRPRYRMGDVLDVAATMAADRKAS